MVATRSNNQSLTPSSKGNQEDSSETPPHRFSALASPPSSSGKQKFTRKTRVPAYKKSVPSGTNRALLELLLGPHRFSDFAPICERNPHLYGSPKSDLRKKTISRRQYLQSLKPNVFAERCIEAGVTYTTESLLQASLRSDSESESSESESEQSIKASPQRLLSKPAPPKRLPSSMSSSSRSASRRAAILPAVYAHEEEHTLNLDYPERNPGGMMAFLTTNVKKNDDELIDVIRITKPLLDSRDKDAIKAKLHDDGSGFTLFEPATPSFMIKEVLEIHALDLEESCEREKEMHQVVANDISLKEARQNKQVTFEFPDGITCNTDNFANHKSGLLNKEFRLLDVLVDGVKGTDSAVMETKSFVFWKLTVDTEARHLKAKAPSEQSDYAKARARMSSMNLG
jgi:hypothetical protein